MTVRTRRWRAALAALVAIAAAGGCSGGGGDCAVQPAAAAETKRTAGGGGRGGEASLVPSLPSGEPVGTTITWTAGIGGPLTHEYRFGVGPAGGPYRVVRDFRPQQSFEWTPMDEGIYGIQMLARENGEGGATTEEVALFEVVSRVRGGCEAVIVETAHPLVALYSAAPCPEGDSMRIEFQPAAGGEWTASDARACKAGQSMNFLAGGLRGETAYEVRHVVVSGNREKVGKKHGFTTAAPAISFPAFTVRQSVDASTSLADRVLFQSVNAFQGEPLPVATDLEGQVVWYYDRVWSAGGSGLATRVVPSGTVLVIASNGGIDGRLLLEIDLAGNTVRETNVSRVNEQLVAMGKDRIGAFHHEATRFPNGQTLVLASVERVMSDAQGSADPVDILGAMIVALDDDWQVIWAWNAFDHLDVERAALLDEKCFFQSPGCPPLFLAPIANDWIHANSVTASPEDGNILFSSRSQDWVLKIDYRDGAGTGGILWRLGMDGDFAIESSDPYPWFSHQHDASYLDATHLILFDDGNTRCNGAASPCDSRGQVLEIDEIGRLARLDLNADMGNFSMALGSAQRLSNGNYQFASGMQVQLPEVIGQSIEVLPDGTKNYVQETQAALYRTYRMPSLYAPIPGGGER